MTKPIAFISKWQLFIIPMVLLVACRVPKPIAVSDFSWRDEYQFTKADTLRGTLSAERSCFDVTHYDLSIDFDIQTKTIAGSNVITFDWLAKQSVMQIDLFANMVLDSVLYKGKQLDYSRQANAVFIDASHFSIHESEQIVVHYHGKPTIAKNAPWDGGFTWKQSANGNVWFAVSCEGIGASLWWPNKDHLSDEPNSMSMRYTVPEGMQCIGNGRLVSEETANGKMTFHWMVSNPINNYNVTFYAGSYIHLQDRMKTVDGNELSLDYYVLPENETKAIKHFKQVPGVIEAFEHYFGEYPWVNDGYKLVESPYLGMEHQSAIAYGNGYMRGYRGGMIPPEMDWDYIIVHETGHEYWGNSVSCTDHAEMWIHESFTTYMEALYVEYHLGLDAAYRYMSFFRLHGNKQPIVGPMNVNFGGWNSSDHYFKGSWVLHTLRNVINDDTKWFGLLKALHLENKKSSNNTTASIVQFINAYTGQDYTTFFDQYLYNAQVPVLVIKPQANGKYCLYFKDVIDGFSIPLTANEQTVVISKKPTVIDLKMPLEDWKKWLNDRYLLDITVE